MDDIDRRLLEILQENGSLSFEALSERVGRSPSAVQRRVGRLTRAGVIERTIAIVDPARVAKGESFIVGIEVERERPELVQQLRDWLRREPAIQQAYYVTGSADYVLIVLARSMAEFDSLMSELMAANPNVRRFTTSVVMSTVKRGLFVPVE